MSDIPKYEDTSPISYEDTLPIEKQPQASSELDRELQKELEGYEPTQAMAAVRGAARGATSGFSEEALAALRAATEVAGPRAQFSDLAETYRKFRDVERAKEEKLKDAFYKTYVGSELGGAVASTTIPLLKVGTLAKAATLGGLTGLGESEADLTKGELGKTALDVAIGAGAGAAGFKVGESLGKYFKPEELEAKAAKHAADALSIPGTPSKRVQVGKDVLQSKALSEGISESSENALKAYADNLGKVEIPKLLQEANQKIQTSGKPVADASQKLLDYSAELKKRLRYAPSDVAEVFEKDMIPEINKYAEMIKGAGGDLLELNKIKQALYDASKDLFKSRSNVERYGQPMPSTFLKDKNFEKMYADMAGVLKEHIESAAEAASTGLGGRIKDLNRRYGSTIDALEYLKPKVRVEPAVASEVAGGITQVTTPKKAAKALGSELIEKAYGGTKLGIAKAESKLAESIKKAPPLVKFATEEAGKTVETGAAKMLPSKTVTTKEDLFGTPRLEEEVSKPTSMIEPAKDSANITSQNKQTLTNTLAKMEQTPELADKAVKIKEALDENDTVAKNARLMALSQDPRYRALINKILNESDSTA